MTEKEQIELAIRRARDRIYNLPVKSLDVIQALDFLAEEFTKIGRRSEYGPTKGYMTQKQIDAEKGLIR